jgi:hypothetical protein
LLAEYPPGDVSEIFIRYCKVISLKDVYLRFMLKLNENFDDDLLQEAIELLD